MDGCAGCLIVRRLIFIGVCASAHDDLVRVCTVENKDLTDEADIEKAIKLGEYIRNGTFSAFVPPIIRSLNAEDLS